MPLPNRNLIANAKTGYRRIPRWGRITIITILAFLLLLVIFWFVMLWYINSHKQELLTRITTEVSDNIDGNFHIDDMEPSLKSFPNISVRLTGVTLSDSLYKDHKKNLLELRSVYVKLNVLSLMTKRPKIMKVTIADGNIYLFADKTGYTNTYLFKKKEPGRKKPGKDVQVNNFGIENVTFTFDHFERNKQFKVTIHDMDGTIKDKGNVLDISADTKAHFHQLGFNLDKGGFVKNKDLDADLHILFDKTTKQVKLPKQEIDINGTDIMFGCVFNFGNKPVDYTIDINAPSIPFREGTSFLSRHIAKKLDSFNLEDPLSVTVLVNGSFRYPDTPLIRATWEAKNNTLLTPFGQLANASLKGEFYNNIYADKGRGDDNSAVTISTIKATYLDIPFKADSVIIYGLLDPLLKFRVTSTFPVEKLNAIAGNTFSLQQGTADIDLRYRGPVVSKDTFQHSMFGHINIKDAALTYLPRSLSFQKCNINIAFNGNDLYLRNTTLSSKRSSIKLDGVASNFMNMYFSDPGRVVFNWDISSSLIDLNEFKSFLAPRKKTTANKKARNRKLAHMNNQLELLLEKSNMYLRVNVGKLIYRRFDAQQIYADIDLTEAGIALKNVKLQHAGGSLAANAFLHQSGRGIPFDLQARINNVKVDKLFYAFENFGQSTLDAKHLAGAFSADINVKGALRETGEIVKNSVNGKVSFVLNNGELNNFPPFESIKKIAFKKRNLSHITFSTLKNQLDIANGKIQINPMSIESSALKMNIQGVYAFDRGTDISLEIPLRNPQKDEERIAKGLKPRKGGIIVYLRARDGNDGKVNISWDPLKKGLKQNGENPDEDVMQE
jgi:hypothetical protein